MSPRREDQVRLPLVPAAPARAPLRRIPFYPPEHPTWNPGGVELGEPLRASSACQRCALHRTSKTVCMASLGPAAGVPLLVLPTPAQKDDVSGGLVESGTAAMVLEEARRHVPGVRVTWAVRCAAGRPEDSQVEACRPYLAGELALDVPRAVLFGPVAAAGALGRYFDAARTRRAWATIQRAGAGPLTCFLVMDPGVAARNRFRRKQFSVDVEWALRAPARPRPDGEVEVLLEPERAVAWLEAATRDPVTVDGEWWPQSPWAVVPERDGGKFRLLCLGLCQDPAAPVVIPEEVLLDEGVRRALRRVLEDFQIPKVNANIKEDRHAIWRALGIDVVGVEWDTMLVARLMNSDSPAGLARTAWQAGFGGYKELGQRGASDEDDAE